MLKRITVLHRDKHRFPHRNKSTSHASRTGVTGTEQFRNSGYITPVGFFFFFIFNLVVLFAFMNSYITKSKFSLLYKLLFAG